MFERKLFKKNAKGMLKRYYWKAVLVVVILALLPAVLQLLASEYNMFNALRVMFAQAIPALYSGDPETMQAASSALTQAQQTPLLPSELQSIMMPVYTAFSLLIAVILPVSYSRFFLRARENPADIGEILYPVKKNYGTNLGAMYAMQLIISLWVTIPMVAVAFIWVICMVTAAFSSESSVPGISGMLLMVFSLYAAIFASVIPGMIKSYQYSMIPFILAENPKMGFKRVFQLTKDMTKGYKWKLFVLDLSFIGWNILALLVPVVGGLLLSPYIYAARAEAYTFLKARVLEKGLATAEDFPGLRDIPAAQTAPAVPAAQSEAAPVQEISEPVDTPELAEAAENEIETVAETETATETETIEGETENEAE